MAHLTKSARRRREYCRPETTLVDPGAGAAWDVQGCDPSLGELAHDTIDTDMSAVFDLPADDEARDTCLDLAAHTAHEPTRVAPILTPIGNRSRRPARRSRTEPVAGARPTLTADAVSQRSRWTNNARQARQSLAERRDQREALARVIALARPKTRSLELPRTRSRRRTD